MQTALTHTSCDHRDFSLFAEYLKKCKTYKTTCWTAASIKEVKGGPQG